MQIVYNKCTQCALYTEKCVHSTYKLFHFHYKSSTITVSNSRLFNVLIQLNDVIKVEKNQAYTWY